MRYATAGAFRAALQVASSHSKASGPHSSIAEATAVRYRVRADLAGRRFEEFNLDIGFNASGDLPQEILR